jgi:hypothetical protein
MLKNLNLSALPDIPRSWRAAKGARLLFLDEEDKERKI